MGTKFNGSRDTSSGRWADMLAVYLIRLCQRGVKVVGKCNIDLSSKRCSVVAEVEGLSKVKELT